jgi:hypothetical protein
LRPGKNTERHAVFDLRAWGDALSTQSVSDPADSFVSVVGAYETTLSLLLKAKPSGFHSSRAVVFAFIGFTLTLAQGSGAAAGWQGQRRVMATAGGGHDAGFVLPGLPAIGFGRRVGGRGDRFLADDAVAAVADQP